MIQMQFINILALSLKYYIHYIYLYEYIMALKIDNLLRFNCSV